MSGINFNPLFAKNSGRPIEYNGKTLHMNYRIGAAGALFRVTIEETSSPYIQGIGFHGLVEIFGKNTKNPVVFEDVSLPPTERAMKRSALPFTFTAASKDKTGCLSLHNVALLLDGRQSWYTGGSAMIVEPISGGFRFRCNDFEPDEDFNDLIFRVEYA